MSAVYCNCLYVLIWQTEYPSMVQVSYLRPKTLMAIITGKAHLRCSYMLTVNQLSYLNNIFSMSRATLYCFKNLLALLPSIYMTPPPPQSNFGRSDKVQIPKKSASKTGFNMTRQSTLLFFLSFTLVLVLLPTLGDVCHESSLFLTVERISEMLFVGPVL